MPRGLSGAGIITGVDMATIPSRFDLVLSSDPPRINYYEIDIPGFDLTLSLAAPVLNAEFFYWNQGVVVSEQISSMGFSMPGHGPGMFLEIRATNARPWEVISIEVPRG